MFRSVVHLLVGVGLLVLGSGSTAALAQSERCATDGRYPNGAVIALENTPHLWLFDGGALRWVGDTRALARQMVRWDRTCVADLELVRRANKADPFLSAGLVKIGDPIYLAKWEENEATPTLLHIQSIQDVELFGINANNYGRFVLEPDAWQRQYGFSPDTLRRGQLPVAVAPRARASFPVALAPSDDTQWWCLPTNPSCGREPWWAQWNELQGTDLVQYSFAPGLVTESRFVEAIGLLSQWPEGKRLLQQAGSNDVRIVAVPAERLTQSFAAYSTGRDEIRVSRTYTETSTWMLADVLAHELQHAADDRDGLYQTNTSADCITSEQRAYRIEWQFVRWLTARMGSLPSVAQVRQQLSTDDYTLYRNIQSIANARDPEAVAAADYRQSCARGS